MLTRKLLQQILLLACPTWAATASASNSPAAADDGNFMLLAVGGIVLIVVLVLVWRSRASRRAKNSDPAAFMTLDQITRLETPGDDSPFARTVQPKPISAQTSEKPAAGKTAPSASDAYMSELEKDYPRIVEKLVMLWPDPESESYLQGLSFDERGDREGFNREIASEIMMLYGVKLKEHTDVWR